ncbi:MAG: hypothetical protein EOO29_20235, partial [Comamonadaceae bacterium]
MQLRHVLAVVDFSTDAGAVAAWRAAHLAWAHEAELCLLSQVDVPCLLMAGESDFLISPSALAVP